MTQTQTPVGRSQLALCVALILVATAPLPAKRVLVDVESARPSVGPGSGGPEPAPTKIWTDVQEITQPPVRTAALDTPEPPKTSAPGITFTGVNQTPSLDGGYIYKPPDTHMAVGPGAGGAGRIVMVTNAGVQIFNKAGSSVAGPTDLDAFLGGAGAGLSAIGVGNTAFDPKVLYDQHSGRFFIVALDGRTPNPGGKSNVWIAVSSNSTPGNLTTDWTKLVGSALTTFGSYNTWFDYPSIGADSGSLYVTGNMFDSGGTSRGTKIRVFNKASLLAGSYSYNDIDVDASVTPGAFTIQPAHVFGSTDNGHFYLINRYGSTAFRLWEISGAPAAPTLVGNATYSWSAGAQVNGAPQQGVTGITIDTLSPRVINAVYRGGYVWCALSSDTDSDGQTEVKWFKIATNGGVPAAPSIADHGSINGSAANKWVFLPSIAVNSRGDAMICYSQSGNDQYVDMRIAGRDFDDPAGTFRSPVVVATSAGEYDDFSTHNPERWGDYSACVVDPDDDISFWAAHEVVQSARSAGDDARWGTRIAGPAMAPVHLSGFSLD